jgi:hypothetical protein
MIDLGYVSVTSTPSGGLHNLLGDAHQKRDKFEANLKELKMLFDAVKQKEGEIQKKQGWTEKTLANSIESEVLKQCKVHLSCFHGGNLVGEPIRMLMREGKLSLKTSSFMLQRRPTNCRMIC